MRKLIVLAGSCRRVCGVSHAQEKVLRVVPHSNLAILDPIWTTAYMSRNHGYMIYDTLFGTDEKNRVQPQMVESWTESPDHRLWTFKLRKGLAFHDGKPVTGEDVVASLAALGQARRHGRGADDLRRPHGLARARQLPHLPARGLRLRAGGAGQALLQRALHHAQARRRDRPLQADRGLHRLGPLHLQARRVQARRQGGLPEEHQVRAAQGTGLRHRRRQERVRRPRRVEPRAARRAGAGQRPGEGRGRHHRGDRLRPVRQPVEGKRHQGDQAGRRPAVHVPLQPPAAAVRQGGGAPRRARLVRPAGRFSRRRSAWRSSTTPARRCSPAARRTPAPPAARSWRSRTCARRRSCSRRPATTARRWC